MNRDLGITRLIRDALPEWSLPLFELTALLGDELVVVGVLCLLALIESYRSFRRGDDQPLSDRTGFVLALVLGGLAFTLILKTVFDAPRPPASLQAVPREGEGFPSGHTMAATILWTSLALWTTRGTLTLRLLAATLLIALVAFSRLALGVHFVSDVVASVVFGAVYILLVSRLTDHRPMATFGGAVLLGTGALVVTGGSANGWLAFIGCTGGAIAWWVLTLESVRQVWVSSARDAAVQS